MVTDDSRRQEFERLSQVDSEASGWPPRPTRQLENEESEARGRPFPGLAPAVTGWFYTDQFQEPSIGVQVGTVLRSWEERFGARLLKLGPGADAWLLVDCPPRTRVTAEPIAAEHWAFADELHDRGLGHDDFSGLVDTIISRPLWHFWWD